MKFRTDIQILRGLSVLLVVLFHLGFKAIQSGFLGVDVFFVISGFLMALLYERQKNVEFLMRRAKRLLPAYYTVIVFTMIASFILNSPNETAQVVTQVKYATVFSSNIGFWMQNSYFSKSEFNPLLHLWSLGVEIQFYLIVPLLAYFFSKSRFFLPFFFFSTLLICFVITGISPKTSFFMMPMRLWEFLIGYGAAHYFTNNGAIRFANFKWLGLTSLIILVCIPVFRVDGRSLSIVYGHPGIFSLLVAFSTGGVLVFGLPKAIENSIVGTFFAKLGKYSYSIYLVHFPIIVLYLSSPFSGTVLNFSTFKDFLALLVMIFISSILLHHFVEVRCNKIRIKNLILGSTTLILLFSVLLPLVQKVTIPVEEQLIFKAFTDRSTYRCGKLIRIMSPKAMSCELTDGSERDNKRVMLVGNSHADSIKAAFTKVAQTGGVGLYFIVQNNPLVGSGLAPEVIVKEAIAKKTNIIVLHFSPSSISYETISKLTHISAVANIKVVFIDPVPVWGEHIPKMMYENLRERGELLVQTKEDYLAYNELFLNQISHIKNDNFKHFSVVDFFCKPQCAFATLNGSPLYFDNGHLTLTGSYILNDLFLQIIKEL